MSVNVVVRVGEHALVMLREEADQRVFGSLIVAPVVTCAMAVSLTSYPQLVEDRGIAHSSKSRS